LAAVENLDNADLLAPGQGYGQITAGTALPTRGKIFLIIEKWKNGTKLII